MSKLLETEFFPKWLTTPNASFEDGSATGSMRAVTLEEMALLGARR